jgi:hypothetical protein
VKKACASAIGPNPSHSPAHRNRGTNARDKISSNVICGTNARDKISSNVI